MPMLFFNKQSNTNVMSFLNLLVRFIFSFNEYTTQSNATEHSQYNVICAKLKKISLFPITCLIQHRLCFFLHFALYSAIRMLCRAQS